jgi:hypothetical protein
VISSTRRSMASRGSWYASSTPAPGCWAVAVGPASRRLQQLLASRPEGRLTFARQHGRWVAPAASRRSGPQSPDRAGTKLCR